MTGFLSREIVESIKQAYPSGTRVELIQMDDPYSKLKAGDRATVVHVDDAGTVHCRWDSGSGLGLAYGEDRFRKLTENELAEEQCMDEQSDSGPEMSM